MENLDLNLRYTYEKRVGKQTRLSICSHDSGTSRRSLRRSALRGIADSPQSSPLSQDSDWLTVQENLQETSKLACDFEEYCNNDVAKALTFSSADDLNRDDLQEQMMELEEESDSITEYTICMQETFALLYADYTVKWLNLDRKKPKQIDIYALIDSLNLPDYPYREWGDRLENAIIAAMSEYRY